MSSTTNPFTFQVLLDSSKIDQSKMYYYFHKEVDPNDETLNLYNLFITNPDKFDKYQEEQGDSNFNNASYISFFVKKPLTKEVLFVGIYERLGVAKEQKNERGNLQFRSTLKKREELKEWEGRLFFERPKTGQAYWVTAGTIKDTHNGLPVTQILKSEQSLPFPGFHEFTCPTPKLKSLPDQWKEYLRAMKGVYLLTDRQHHKLYVGSASGENGFLGRWISGYADGAGGNNKELENFIQNNQDIDFHISILEIASSSDDDSKILKKENSWKAKLNTKNLAGNGLNCN